MKEFMGRLIWLAERLTADVVEVEVLLFGDIDDVVDNADEVEEADDDDEDVMDDDDDKVVVEVADEAFVSVLHESWLLLEDDRVEWCEDDDDQSSLGSNLSDPMDLAPPNLTANMTMSV